MKRKIKKYFARAIPVLVIVCVLVPCFAVPALAEPLNYRDYEVSVTVDGNNDIVTLGFPYEQWTDWALRPFDGGSEYETGQGDYFQGEFPWMDNYDKFYLMIAPFGGASFSNKVSPYEGFYLSTDNIPSDAKWSAGLVILADDEANTMSSIHFTSRSWVVDGSTASIYEHTSSTSLTKQENYHYDVTFSGDVCTDFDGWFPQFLFHFSADSSIFWCALTSFEVTMSINSYYRVLDEMGYDEQIDELRQELEQQNIKLDNLVEQQTQTNDKLDNIINGEVTPDTPVGSDKVDDLDNAEGALRDQAQAGLDESLQVQQSALAILLEYAGAFAVFSWLFGLFADIPFLKGLLYVSMAVGLFASVLSIAQSASSFSSRHAPKEPSIKYHYHWHSGYRNRDKGE